MSTHKADLTKLSINQISLVTGKAYNTVKQLLAGLDPIDKDGRTLLFLAKDALSKVYGAKAESESERLDRLRADQLELDLSIRRGEYAPYAIIEHALADVSGQVRAILEAIPNQLKKRNRTLKARELRIVKSELTKAQNAIADIQLSKNNSRAKKRTK